MRKVRSFEVSVDDYLNALVMTDGYKLKAELEKLLKVKNRPVNIYIQQSAKIIYEEQA